MTQPANDRGKQLSGAVDVNPARGPVNRAVAALQEFLRLESAGGLVLVAASVFALLAANSPLGVWYQGALLLPIEVRAGAFAIAKPLVLWINDGLMAVFFLLVGLELKREMLEGHLSSLRRASLPAWAAVGGMLAPAAIYVLFNRGDSAALTGWAIPTATDIAFALGIMSLLGGRVPRALKAFLLSVAIFDDLGAILIIALFYTAELSTLALGTAAALTAGLAILNRLGVTRMAPYLVVGIVLWVAVVKSGVHATLAGVVTALAIPLRPHRSDPAPSIDAPLHRLEHSLHPWVAFCVLPLFAFANAGVSVLDLSVGQVLHPIPLGIAAGLFVGKQLGITGIALVAVRLRVASLPEGIGWSQLYAVGVLCGIGFTMSLFIASLSFAQGQTLSGLDRLGVLLGSLVSGAAGYALLRRSLRSP